MRTHVYLAPLLNLELRTKVLPDQLKFASASPGVCIYVSSYCSFLNICSGPSGIKKSSFIALAVLLILLSIGFMVFEICLLFIMVSQQKYSVIYEAVIRSSLFPLTIIFVFGFWNDCWCAPAWQWQIGALAVFLAYVNLILHLRGLPVVGVYINLLISIVFKFIQLLYLTILLILAFAIPFYMVFVRDGAAVFVSYTIICPYTCVKQHISVS